MKISLLQFNPVNGAVQLNADGLIEQTRQAVEAGASVVVAPELALSGYNPADLIWRLDFMRDIEEAIQRIASAIPANVLLVLGAPVMADGRIWNAAVALKNGRRVATVFRGDEAASSRAAGFAKMEEVAAVRVEHDGIHFLVGMGVPAEAYRTAAAASGMNVVLDIGLTPYAKGQPHNRSELACGVAQALALPVISLNGFGGHDEWVYAGGSFVCSPSGDIVARAPHAVVQKATNDGSPSGDIVARAPLFDGHPWTVEWNAASGAVINGDIAPWPVSGGGEEVYCALKTGLRDYVAKNNFPGAIIGLSGGIDSALVAALAVDALGAGRVFGVTMPSKYSSGGTHADALTLADNLGIRCVDVSIEPAVKCLDEMLAKSVGELETTFMRLPGTLMEENLQARLRCILLMSLSNRFGHLVLNTGNRSEALTGYSTLYGDTCGGIAVLGDIFKTDVFALAVWRNTQGEVIPPSIIARPPSAELREGQLDSDSLPPYDQLDPILEALTALPVDAAAILGAGVKPDVLQHVQRLMFRSEYKRRQEPFSLHIQPRPLSRDIHIPLTTRLD